MITLSWSDKGFELEKTRKYKEAIEVFRNFTRLSLPGEVENLIFLIKISSTLLKTS